MYRRLRATEKKTITATRNGSGDRSYSSSDRGGGNELGTRGYEPRPLPQHSAGPQTTRPPDATLRPQVGRPPAPASDGAPLLRSGDSPVRLVCLEHLELHRAEHIDSVWRSRRELPHELLYVQTMQYLRVHSTHSGVVQARLRCCRPQPALQAPQLAE